jgi:hypothetical protein
MPSISLYLEIHAGPQFGIASRYSAILLQIAVALFYGAGLPILYAIACLGCFL